jgi:hypothetical protein
VIGLTGDDRKKALAEIRGKIERGEVKPRGKNRWAKPGGVEGKAPEKAESGVMRTGSLREQAGKVEDRFDRLANMVKKLEALGCEVNITLSISMETR